MDPIPEDTDEIGAFLLDEVLYGIDLDPTDFQTLTSSLAETHDHLFGPHTTYFILGSYETPFKYRLDSAADVLNRRLDAYAYLLVTQPDLDVADDVPALKVKFYFHCLAADHIALILEHNTGGVLTELGRLDRPLFFQKTYAYCRGYTDRYEDPTTVEETIARAIELAYSADDLDHALAALDERARELDLKGATKHDLERHLDDELGTRRPDYSGVLTDALVHYATLGRLTSWTLKRELFSEITTLP